MTAGQKIFIGAVSGAIQTGTLRGALISAFSAGVSHGIGGHFDKAEALNGGTLGFPDTVKKIMAHAVAGGVAETLRGGKFGHGFASAGFVELAGPHVSTALGNSAAGQIVTAAILGGTASHLVGGKFANGALTAAMQWAFNELGDKYKEFELRFASAKSMIEGEFPELSRFLVLSGKNAIYSGSIAEYVGGEIRFRRSIRDGSEAFSENELIETAAHEALHGLVNEYVGGYPVYFALDIGTWAMVPNDSRFGSGMGVYHAWIQDGGMAVRDYLVYPGSPRPDLSINGFLKFRDNADWYSPGYGWEQ